MDKTIDPLGDCCYGMGFGPEGDGVELFKDSDIFTIEILTNTIKHHSGADLKPAKTVGATMMWASNTSGPMTGYKFRDPGSFEGIQWPQWAFDDKPESNAKPALPALTRQAGEKYKGLGFCDGCE